VAYGFPNLLKSVLITESTVVPDTGQANVNVLNTSVDIGPVDVYVSTTQDLSVSTLIASGITGVSQSAFAGILAGSYYVTVVGANSIAQGVNDQRFQTPTPIVLTALQVLTIILTPGASGVLANAIMLTQGTTGTAVSYLNTTARLRAVTAIPGSAVAVAEGVLPSNTTPQYSDYVVVTTGAPPVVTVNSATIATTMVTTTTTGTGTTAVTTSTVGPAVLVAGGDYTLMVYLDGNGNPVSSMIEDDNTAPVTASGVKFRLINLASNNQGLSLSMSINAVGVASLVTYGNASKYKELTTPQTTNSKSCPCPTSSRRSSWALIRPLAWSRISSARPPSRPETAASRTEMAPSGAIFHFRAPFRRSLVQRPGGVPNLPARKSSTAWKISACLFITNGPYCAIGSFKGLPAMIRARAPSAPACTRTPSRSAAFASTAMRSRGTLVRVVPPSISSSPR